MPVMKCALPDFQERAEAVLPRWERTYLKGSVKNHDDAKNRRFLMIFHTAICAGASQICLDGRRKSEICVCPVA